MSVVSLADTSVLRGTVTFPLRGAWSASLVLGGTTPPVVGSSTTLTIGGVPFVGTVVESASDAGNLVSVRVVGGRAGLSKKVTAQGYFATTAGLVIEQALAVGSETVSPLSDQDVLATPLAYWSRYAVTVGEAIVQVLEVLSAMSPGTTYGVRALADGSIWFGAEEWLPLELDVIVESESAAEQWLSVAIESATILPGSLFRGHQVREVTYTVDETRLRARVAFGDRSGVGGLLAAAVKKETQPLRLMGLATATVKAMNADGTADIQPADLSVPGLSHIPIRMGGVSSIKLLPGTGVLLGHEDAQNHKPAIVGIYTGIVQSLLSEAVESIELRAAAVKAGGELSLVLHDVLLAWTTQLQAQNVAIGLTVPPLVGANTQILKGS